MTRFDDDKIEKLIEFLKENGLVLDRHMRIAFQKLGILLLEMMSNESGKTAKQMFDDYTFM
jgi:hypothetical protein